MSTDESSNKGEIVEVIFVRRQDAKHAKTLLEENGLMDKDFRMTPRMDNASSQHSIAIPVRSACTEKALRVLDNSVQAVGTHFCPYSSAQLGNRRHQQRTKDFDLKLSLVQRVLWKLSKEHASRLCQNGATSHQEMLEPIQSFPLSVCPKNLELFGDDRTLVIPQRALNPSADTKFSEWVRTTLCSSIDTANSEVERLNSSLQELWKELAENYQSPRVVRKGAVDPESRIRESGFTMLWPCAESCDDATRTPEESPAWITVTENGIRQSFDLTQVMFSRGNISEKIRFGNLVQNGETVLDLYAGIGYFTLPALVHGKAKHVYACEWNPRAVEALRYNLKDNQVDDRATVFIGDCRTSARIHNVANLVDRVSLGLLPSSEGGWQTAVRALRRSTGGWLHVHANVPVHEVGAWSQWLCWKLRELVRLENLHNEWVILLTHVEKVKSFAPTVNHYVGDVMLGQPERVVATARNGGVLEAGMAGVLHDNSTIKLLPGIVDSPTCALSQEGALHQSWMREEQEEGGDDIP